MRTRGRGASRQAVEDAFGRDCVAAVPSERPAIRLATPWDNEILVLRDTDLKGLSRLVARDGYASIRFWLSPCGDRSIAWTAGNVAHFQLYSDLAEQGWHHGRIVLDREDGPVIAVQEQAVDILLEGKAGFRLAGGPFTVHTNLRTLRSDEPAQEPTPSFGP